MQTTTFSHFQQMPHYPTQPLMMQTGYFASPTPAYEHPQTQWSYAQPAVSPQPLNMSFLVASPTGGFATPPASNNSTVSAVSSSNSDDNSNASTMSGTSMNPNSVSLASTPTTSLVTPLQTAYFSLPHAVFTPPGLPGCNDQMQMTWMAPSNLTYPQISSPHYQQMPYQQPQMQTEARPCFAPAPQMNVQYSPPHSATDYSQLYKTNMNSVRTNNNYKRGHVRNSSEESQSDDKCIKNCNHSAPNSSRPRFRTRCKACSAAISRGCVRQVNLEDIAEAFADRTSTLDQLPEFFGEPQLNFPEIVYYMRIFRQQGRGELQYFKVPRPTKERELHVDVRLAELFIRNYGFDHACEAHEFSRLPVHTSGICQARMAYRQTIVESLLPQFLPNVRNMEEAKNMFNIIFRYVGCSTPKDICSTIPQVWVAVSDVDDKIACELTGVVSLFNYHLFRRMIVKSESY